MDIFTKCENFTLAKDYREKGIYPYFHALESRQDVEVIMEGKRRIMLGSNNYLGLTTQPEVVEAGIKAFERYGTGCSGSRFLNGTLEMHLELEAELAGFVHKEGAVTFSTGFQSNLGIISAIAGRNDYVICDRENHASIYDGCNAQKWGYGFARNKYGAPVSIELMEEVEFLCAKGYLSKDSSGYYRISDTASLNSILSISKSGILGWRSKYIEVVFDSLLTKSFPRVVRAVQNEPGISLLESINRTSTLLESSLINALYEDFGVLKEIIGDPQIDLVVPASLWIDYLSVQKQ